MSIMQPPQSPSKPKPTLRTRFTWEWSRFEKMPYTRLLLLLLPSILLFIFDPLIPIMGYLLQLWAGSSHTWRERWASLVAAAKKCGILLAALAIYLLLDHAQIWIIRTCQEPSHFRPLMDKAFWHVRCCSCRWPRSWPSTMNTLIPAPAGNYLVSSRPMI